MVKVYACKGDKCGPGRTIPRRIIAVLSNTLALTSGAIRSAATKAVLAHDGLERGPDHKVNRQWEEDTTPPAASSGTVTVAFEEYPTPVTSVNTLLLCWQVSGSTVVQHLSRVSVSDRTGTMKLSSPGKTSR